MNNKFNELANGLAQPVTRRGALQPVSRRRFLRALSAVGTVSLAAPSLPRILKAQPSVTPAGAGSAVIKHVVVSIQENRSFDHYYGFAPFAGPFGVPLNYSQPDGSGGKVFPFHLTSLTTADLAHEWTDIHDEWDNGRMDGFYTTDGIDSMGYYTAAELPFYYSLFDSFTLCGNYFCSLLGPTFPNRLYLCGGTSGGNTSNNIAGGSLDYPIILDLLDQFGITWKNYNVGTKKNSSFLNAFELFARWQKDKRVTSFFEDDYYNDLNGGVFPQVAFITPSLELSEHPSFNIQDGQATQQSLIAALMSSSIWSGSAYLLTYDEGGGYFEHVAPPIFDAYGAGIRVPTWVISPHAKPANIQRTLYEHSSVLKFLEFVFGLPTLASVNHEFDTCTPGTNNDAANGNPTGPPAPPRDGLTAIGNLTECFVNI